MDMLAVDLSDLPASGFRFFVSVYRGEHERAFSELEAMVFGEFCQHLMQLWQQRVWESLGLSQAGEGDQRALCDAQGRLIYLGSAVAQTLARHLQDWQGEVLPGELLAFMVALGLITLLIMPLALGVRTPPMDSVPSPGAAQKQSLLQDSPPWLH